MEKGINEPLLGAKLEDGGLTPGPAQFEVGNVRELGPNWKWEKE
jgi:hypothetical protein